MSAFTFDADLLDNQEHLVSGDPSGMLRAVASSAAQVRVSYRASVDAGLSRLAGEGRPRAVVVAGMGGSGIAGDVMAAVCGPGAALPIVTVRSHRLPGWVGAADLVIAVSCSGRTEETLSAATEAVRRGSRLLAVGGAKSPLAEVARQARGLFVPVATTGQPRANLWALSVPLVVAAAALGLAEAEEKNFEDTARSLEDIAHRCRPGSESFINPGKTLAAELAGSVPTIWGSSPLAAVAAYRLACQLNENAKYPAIWGEIPEAGHNQVMALEGPLAGRDIFADEETAALRVLVFRDTDEHPRVAKQREAALRLAHDRGVRTSEMVAQGVHPLERLASLIEVSDYASVYLALGYGIDPTPVASISEIKARISH
ncbi:SIS domain-containing protein [Sinosporangium siamense]|uniref:Bifunctional glucose-6-phosphate/mannose-6-phosphate isomerase n=1 Tax=Sinosporangium siamense TaxID=1367973 RepID=A0A919RCQ4_9ACTN|nr:SIS domain-containing protein [Sinosporangium siamense]GII91032.1 bifunctional glucose-6-phosphate/mannose-6-phosphate isomerase [Sinosporangium siamense]